MGTTFTEAPDWAWWTILTQWDAAGSPRTDQATGVFVEAVAVGTPLTQFTNDNYLHPLPLPGTVSTGGSVTVESMRMYETAGNKTYEYPPLPRESFRVVE